MICSARGCASVCRATNISCACGMKSTKRQRARIPRVHASWITLHMLPTIYYVAERHQSAYAFLKKSGMKWEEKVRALTPATLANAAKLHADGHAEAHPFGELICSNAGERPLALAGS